MYSVRPSGRWYPKVLAFREAVRHVEIQIEHWLAIGIQGLSHIDGCVWLVHLVLGYPKEERILKRKGKLSQKEIENVLKVTRRTISMTQLIVEKILRFILRWSLRRPSIRFRYHLLRFLHHTVPEQRQNNPTVNNYLHFHAWFSPNRSNTLSFILVKDLVSRYLDHETVTS